ncbi:hypothetical protein DIJ64_00795 [Mycobacterium leprae]|uniref:Uncharacterized protein n=1 Tax=Mycobacterium leprae TaxID=1769 RepID=A0AAD0KQT0_MYCLR|nr:hypothetical protein [Mycobacterium leprae]AWV47144.1 hypothetical protein DIJ64_00795 [Mycobacterium leprae]
MFVISTAAGIIMLLYWALSPAIVALLPSGGVIFIPGARVVWIVHALPLLPPGSVMRALHSR